MERDFSKNFSRENKTIWIICPIFIFLFHSYLFRLSFRQNQRNSRDEEAETEISWQLWKLWNIRNVEKEI